MARWLGGGATTFQRAIAPSRELSWGNIRRKELLCRKHSKGTRFCGEEINEFDEVMEGHGDFCVLVAARGTTNIFAKVGCKRLRDVNKPTIAISPADLANIPS